MKCSIKVQRLLLLVYRETIPNAFKTAELFPAQKTTAQFLWLQCFEELAVGCFQTIQESTCNQTSMAIFHPGPSCEFLIFKNPPKNKKASSLRIRSFHPQRKKKLHPPVKGLGRGPGGLIYGVPLGCINLNHPPALKVQQSPTNRPTMLYAVNQKNRLMRNSFLVGGLKCG